MVESADEGGSSIELPAAEEELERDLLLWTQLLRHAKPEHHQIRLDGRDLSGDYLLVEVMNTPTLGPRLQLAANADPTDGLVDLVLAEEKHRRALEDALRRRLKGEDVTVELPQTRGRELELISDGAVAHIDGKLWEDGSRGEAGLRGPLTVSLHRHGVTLWVTPRRPGP